jgi:1-acyl-sn-glycerol-3-phosphate acyltransferase
LREYFDVSLHGTERIPDGPVLLVGNHALLGIDAVVLFPEIYDRTGRVPRGLALRSLFRVPVVRSMLRRIGVVEGRRDNAMALLERGELLVTYPGGARDSVKGRSERYTLKWDGRHGFANVAVRSGTPVVPVAAIGPDEAFPLHGDRGLVSLPFLGGDSCRVPFFLPVPRPLPFEFHFGEPIEPPSPDASTSDGAKRDATATREFAARVHETLQGMLDARSPRSPASETMVDRVADLIERLPGD